MLTNGPWFIRLLRYTHDLLGGAFLLFLIFIGINTFLFTTYTVDGHSMDPTLSNGQYVGLFLANYLFTQPKIGDIVVVRYAGDSRIHFVKRIEGVPGDTVSVLDQPVVLGPNQYLVEGDNRDHSTDSRVFGPINRNQIIGRVIFY